jgi:hypothetical protein
LRYQWLFNAVEIGNATNAAITLTNLQAGGAGAYTVRVSDEEGSIESQAWIVDVEPTFTRIIGSMFNIAGGSSGVSWTDVNEDGWPDLWIGSKNGSPILLTNRMDGTFGRASSGVSGGIGSGVFADFDNDGHIDLFLAGANTLYRGNGKASFARTNINFSGISSFCASWADYNNDGFLDLFAGNYYTGGLNAFFRNNGNGGFTRITTNSPALDRSNSQGVTWTITTTMDALTSLWPTPAIKNVSSITTTAVVSLLVSPIARLRQSPAHSLRAPGVITTMMDGPISFFVVTSKSTISFIMTAVHFRS